MTFRVLTVGAPVSFPSPHSGHPCVPTPGRACRCCPAAPAAPHPSPRGTLPLLTPSTADQLCLGLNFMNFCMEACCHPFPTGFSHCACVCEVHPWRRGVCMAVMGSSQLLRAVPLCEYTRVSGVIAPECHREMQRVCEVKAGLRLMAFASVG